MRVVLHTTWIPYTATSSARRFVAVLAQALDGCKAELISLPFSSSPTFAVFLAKFGRILDLLAQRVHSSSGLGVPSLAESPFLARLWTDFLIDCLRKNSHRILVAIAQELFQVKNRKLT